jgi:hypothetical protein
MHSFVVRVALRQHVPLQYRFKHITRRSRFAPKTPIANILLRKMIPDAFPLLLREPESFDIYIGSTAVGNFEIGSSCDQERAKQLDVRAFIERAQSRTLNREM